MCYSGSIRAFPLILPILISSLLIPTSFAGTGNPLSTICHEKTILTNTYKTSLHNLFNDLQKNTPATGFGECSSGHDTDRAFGISLCRGDVSEKDCRACVKNATEMIVNGCPGSRAAIIWYDNCFLRYSDKNFSGQIDTDDRIRLLNTMNSTEPEGFKKTTLRLLNKLTRNASDSTNERMFSGGTTRFDKENVRIYGMAQCSGDLSPVNCTDCLGSAVQGLPWDVTINRTRYTCPVGARTVTGSCYVRYEIYPFLNTPYSGHHDPNIIT